MMPLFWILFIDFLFYLLQIKLIIYICKYLMKNIINNFYSPSIPSIVVFICSLFAFLLITIIILCSPLRFDIVIGAYSLRFYISIGSSPLRFNIVIGAYSLRLSIIVCFCYESWLVILIISVTCVWISPIRSIEFGICIVLRPILWWCWSLIRLWLI
jgi:hypothetical protein